MTEIIGISGSLRSGSYNSALLRYAKSIMPDRVTLSIASIAEIPLYNGDVEKAHGIPAAVTEVKAQIEASDGLLLATPEYNNGIPGVMKNAIDWLSRPASDIPKVFGGKPVAVMGASPGNWGTAFAQTAWLPVIRTLGMQPWFGRLLYVSRAGSVFDDEGNMTDESMASRVEQFITDYVTFVREARDR